MEYNLNLYDMITIIRNSWKRILAVAVVCAVLACAAGAVKAMGIGQASSGGATEEQSGVDVYDLWVSSKAEESEGLTDQVMQAYDTALNAPLMQIDPYNCVYRQLVFTLEDAYVIRKDTFESWVSEKFTDQTTGERKYILDVRGNVGEVVITIWDSEGYDVDAAAEEVQAYVVQKAKENNISIIAMNNTREQGLSQIMFEKQDVIRNNILRLQNEKGYFDGSTVIGRSANSEPAGMSKRDLIKLAILGFAGGLVLGVLLALYRVVRRGILLSAAQVRDFFGLTEIGVYEPGNGEQGKTLSAVVSALAEKCESILVFDDHDPEIISALAQTLNDSSDKEFKCGKGLSEEATGVEGLLYADGSIIPVTLGKSTFKDVQRYIRWAQQFKKETVGFIVIEG